MKTHVMESQNGKTTTIERERERKKNQRNNKNYEFIAAISTE